MFQKCILKSDFSDLEAREIGQEVSEFRYFNIYKKDHKHVYLTKT